MTGRSGGVQGWLRGWRLPLRVARRDAARARARSLLVVVMIALPVAGVTGAVVLQQTVTVDTVEGLDRTIGSAAARVDVDAASATAKVQDPEGSTSLSTDSTTVPVLDAAGISAALGGARVVALDDSETRIETDDGVGRAEIYTGAVADPLTQGILHLTSGRWPRSSDEVVVNAALLAQGYVVGDPLRLADDPGRPVIVGVAESGSSRDFPLAAGPAGSLPPAQQQSVSPYLVAGGPVTWADVQRLNALGAVVVSRQVVEHPPPASEVSPDVQGFDGGLDATTATVLALVVTMVLLEVVLLAGPAFAVGTRRLQRTLALMAAAGGTPVQARRVVVAGALVLGVVAAVVGVAVGVAGAAVVLPIAQHHSGSVFGPFQVPPVPVLVVAAFGLVSALLAAVVPAVLASRQDVVAVLAGRRGDAAPSRRSPVLGLVLLGLGVLVAVVGARRPGGETMIAGSALLSVLGMLLLVPAVVGVVARLASRLPLSLRYAARDAARHRTRTTPAVAAVAATVAGAVALLIGATSDAAEAQATYTPQLQRGVGVVSVYGDPGPDVVARVRAVVAAHVPDARLTTVRGLSQDGMFEEATSYTYAAIEKPGSDYEPLVSAYGGTYGSDLLVSDESLPPGLLGVGEAAREAASAALRAGRPVVFTDRPGAELGPGAAALRVTTSDTSTGETTAETTTDLDALLVPVTGLGGGPAAVLPTAVAEAAGLAVSEVGVVVDGAPINEAAQEAVDEGLAATEQDLGLVVERGYQADGETLLIQLILLGLGAVLMLGGTLTATFLALSDAGPDLATLAAVGASPRRRRGVAAGYALVVGFVGAVLGALVGFVPGVAVAFPLTTLSGGVVVNGSGYASADGSGTGPFIDVPWLVVLALVVGLPLLTAAIVAATTRSRLPLVTRLD